MKFSMRFLAVMSLFLLVSISSEMGGPLLADAECDLVLCDYGCKRLGYKRGCCAMLEDCTFCYCIDEDTCEPFVTLKVKIGEMTMTIGTTPKTPSIQTSAA